MFRGNKPELLVEKRVMHRKTDKSDVGSSLCRPSRAILPMVRLLDPGLSRTFGPGSTWAITFHASGVGRVVRPGEVTVIVQHR